MAGRRAQADRDSWIARGYAVLLERGVAAITVEGLARELGVTKGSFYWHFTNRDDLLAAVLDRWAADRTDDVIGETGRPGDAADDPAAVVRSLITRVAASGVGEVRLYAPVDEQHPLVAAAVQAVTATRLDHLSAVLRRLGHPAPDAAARARAALALALGQQVLAGAVPGLPSGTDERDRARALALELLLPAGST